MVIRPHGRRVRELLQAELDRRIKDTGHENASFPLLGVIRIASRQTRTPGWCSDRRSP